MIIDSLLQVLGAGLKLWSSKEASKYLDRYIKLKKEWYEEIAKPEHQQDHARIDNLKFELKLLCDSFTSSVGTTDIKDKA